MQQYEEDKDEKSYQGKYFINEMLVIQTNGEKDRSSNLYSLLNNLDLKCNTRCISNVNTFLEKEDPC